MKSEKACDRAERTTEASREKRTVGLTKTPEWKSIFKDAIRQPIMAGALQTRDRKQTKRPN